MGNEGMEFHEKCRAAMGLAGVGVGELARAIGKRQQVVSRWLNPEKPQKATIPKAAALLAIARALGVTVDYLVDPAREVPDMPDWTEDEKAIIKLYRALRLTPDEALRRLATGPHPKRGDDPPRPAGQAEKVRSRAEPGSTIQPEGNHEGAHPPGIPARAWRSLGPRQPKHPR
jgi:transcriptional regulator with XRE-family HTH domain